MELYTLPKFEDIAEIDLTKILSQKSTAETTKSFYESSSETDDDFGMSNEKFNVTDTTNNNATIINNNTTIRQLSKSTTSLPYNGPTVDPIKKLIKLSKYATTTLEEEIKSQKRSTTKLNNHIHNKVNDTIISNETNNNNNDNINMTTTSNDNDDYIIKNNRNSISDSKRRPQSARPSQMNRRLTQESIITNFPFRASAHRSQIFPIVDTSTYRSILSSAGGSICPSSSSSSSSTTTPNRNASAISLPLSPRSLSSLINHNNRDTTSHDYKSVQSTMSNNIGRRIDEKDVNFNIVHNMLTGIKVSCQSIASDPTPSKTTSTHPTIDKYIFDTKGELLGKNIKSSESYGFKFKDYFGSKFLQIRETFNITNNDYLESLTSQYVLNELNSPGKSGSFFYFSKDYKYIIKTIHHSEHIHLRENLPKYFKYINDNPHTMLCQYYGLHRVKLPRSFKHRISNRKVYLVVMYNVFPPLVQIDLTYDLKGSKLGRFTNVNNEKYENKIRKDLNWIQEGEKIIFKTRQDKAKFTSQLWRDVNLLAQMNTMDYSLLVGIHYKNSQEIPSLSSSLSSQSLIASYRLDSDSVISNDQMIYYVGIIDCLTNYSIVKKLETLIRSINHKTINISAIPPDNYALRFYKFIEKSTEVVGENST
ncbi:phosphatidylinositol 4-phosphate 5-kinase Mss4p [Monosporozyma unispora]